MSYINGNNVHLRANIKITGGGENYEQGYEDGYSAGRTNGYDAGMTEGYNLGHSKGYEQGEREGYEIGYSEGSTDAERKTPLYYAMNLSGSFNGATFPENTEIVMRFKKAPASMGTCFYQAKNIKKITLISEDKSNVLVANLAFRNISTLEIIDLREYNRKFSNIQHMCFGSPLLHTIYGALDLSECTNTGSAFLGCTNLANIEFVPNTIKLSLDFGQCPNLSQDSALSSINGLAVVETAQTLTLPSSAKFTTKQKNDAFAIGWTIAGGTEVSEEEYYG